MERRRFLAIVAGSGLVLPTTLRARSGTRRTVINDVSQLNPIAVAGQTRPRSTAEAVASLRAWRGVISVGGGRFSMGGQIAAADSLHVDMRSMNRVLSLDPERRTIRVQAGITWRDIQDAIDPYDLSVMIMQSYSNFTVGGSVSVNCHGRYVGRGPLVNSVRALQLISANGDVIELSRSREPELFGAVFGGYGGLGLVTEVELELATNTPIKRVVQHVRFEEYPAFFQSEVLRSPRVVLHNADLIAPDFATPRVISWIETQEPLSEKRRLIPRGLDYSLEKNAIWAMTELPGGSKLREVVDKKLLQHQPVVWRNYEASLDTASLEPRTRVVSSYVLQEYFIPVSNFLPFARSMAKILRAHKVNALNVSVRHSPADDVSLLKWAPTEVFSFVLYYKQRAGRRASDEVGTWTRELIDAALDNGGRYYLPYRLDAHREQFERAYPEAKAFVAIKARIDPDHRFRNLLWNKYLSVS